MRSGRQPIFAFWHGRIFARPLLLPRSRDRRDHQPRTSTASGSPASSSASVTERRADPRRAGARARSCRCGAIWPPGGRSGSRVDGPRGPARVAQPGAVWLAGATGHPDPAVPRRGRIASGRRRAGIARRCRSRSPRSPSRLGRRSRCRTRPKRRRGERVGSSSTRWRARSAGPAALLDAELVT